jgi:glutamate racemase
VSNAFQPIGIFDSGIGGLTVANAVSKHLPDEQIIYFGDTAHLPYGEKSADSIKHYSRRIADFLLEMNCKLILVACNTASAAAFDDLSDYIGDKVLLANVIDPVVAAAVKSNDIHKLGIIGTKGTIHSRVYDRKIRESNSSLEVVTLATGLLASMIEEGFYNNSVSQAIINSYLAYPDFQDIDAMILACTHYPLIRKEIDYFYHNRIKVFDSNEPVAEEVANLLKIKNLLSSKQTNPHRFYVSDFTKSFEKTAKNFFTENIQLEHFPLWDDE